MENLVWDLAALFEIMAKHNEEDDYSAAANPFRYDNYPKFINARGFEELCIGRPREPFWNQTYQGYRPFINAGLEATFDQMRSLGATIVDPVVLWNAQE
ncbi:hypothetical protein EKO04_011553 [Ascochyta lentis]|uniref:Uncharacterized protein n=1 Tax=Ascochyta lentis TaxID=205686 RepID=A0A8H7MBE9_9PLEO|nr:hypothetical protein EKO04_011553 [Ascochyta lentis]